MKKTYESPEISIVKLEYNTVTTTVSGVGNDGLSVSLDWLLG